MRLHKLALLTPIVGLVALMSTSIASAQFLDINGGFENGFSGWTRSGFVDESAREYEGDTAARLRSGDAEIRRTIQLQRNTRYRYSCLLYTSPSPRDATLSRMPSSA